MKLKKKNWLLIFIIILIITLCSVYAFIEIQQVSVAGIVKVKDMRNIIIDFPATVKTVKVQDGQKVKLGDILFILEIKDNVITRSRF